MSSSSAGRIQFVAEIFVEKFQVKLVRREMREWRAINDRVFVRFPKINSDVPQLVKFRESKFVVSARLKLDVEFEIIEKAGLSRLLEPVMTRPLSRSPSEEGHDVNLCVQVL